MTWMMILLWIVIALIVIVAIYLAYKDMSKKVIQEEKKKRG